MAAEELVALPLLPQAFVMRRTLPSRAVAEDGFTLVEILVACAIIGLGLVAISSGFNMGIQAVEAGRQQSTAVYLAEQRLDQVRAAAMRATEPPFGYVTAAAFPSEDYGAASLPPAFRRTVALTNFVGPAGGLPTGVQGIRADVAVFYRQITAAGVLTTERSVQLSMFLVSR